jgi:uncharacterized membrane protein YeaQ/YmgE (transglycosylase-associated protein family)
MEWILRESLLTALIYGCIGALNGSFAQQFFHWVNRLNDNRIALAGFLITVLGFILQLIPTVQDLVSSFLSG